MKPAFDPGDATRLSQSVYQRRIYGSAQKRGDFYRAVLADGDVADARFVNDFEALAEDEWHDQLSRKMAVFYADGNEFGKHRAEGCRHAGTAEGAVDFLRGFDTSLRALQSGFLGGVLRTARDLKEWRTPTNEFRIETLLWGGDEMMLVVPARCGWHLLQQFIAHDWSLEVGGQKTPLTFKVGLVFCHHAAPIRRVSLLAHALGDLAAGDKSETRIAYEVLESFDHLGPRPKTARDARAGALSEQLALNAAMVQQLTSAACLKQSDLARGRLVAVAKEARSGIVTGPQIEKLKSPLTPEELQAVSALVQGFPSEAAAWFHMSELWDYLPTKERCE